MLPWEAAKVRDIPLESGGRKGHSDEKCNQAEKLGRLCAPRGGERDPGQSQGLCRDVRFPALMDFYKPAI